jgi:rhodanese-related sulfurtransferase
MTSTDIPEVDVEHLAGDVVLLDVRATAEWIHGHIPGTVNIPLSDLADRIGELDRERTILVICRSGNRSALATQLLRSIGYDAHNVRGGSSAWEQAGKPLVSSSGTPGVLV